MLHIRPCVLIRPCAFIRHCALIRPCALISPCALIRLCNFIFVWFFLLVCTSPISVCLPTKILTLAKHKSLGQCLVSVTPVNSFFWSLTKSIYVNASWYSNQQYFDWWKTLFHNIKTHYRLIISLNEITKFQKFVIGNINCVCNRS